MIRRRLVTFTSVVSLLFFLGTCAQWGRSYHTGDRFIVTDDSRYRFELIDVRGAIAFAWRFSDGYSHSDVILAPGEPKPPPHKIPPDWCVRVWPFPLDSGTSLYHNLARDWRLGGFGLSHHGAKHYAIMPLWVVALAFLGLPIVQITHRIRACDNWERIACGYNLTASTSGVCPECGTAVPSKPEAVA